MDHTIVPKPIGGTLAAIPSKSMAHRLMICAALAEGETEIVCDGTSKDMEATRACLAAMKAGRPLPCGESGSTLRFLLPVVGALGLDAEFLMEGRLPQRPLDQSLEDHGMKLTRPDGSTLKCTGKLKAGDYVLPGNVSSQYISGLLFALPLLEKPSTLTVTGKVESAQYIAMTLDALRQFGVCIEQRGNVYHIPDSRYVSPGKVTVEGDWSNSAFWLCAGAVSKPVTVTGLNPASLQGDKEILELLKKFGAKTAGFTVEPAELHGIDIDASAIPDLVPVLAVVAAAAKGKTRIYNAGRLRLKESDRIASVCGMLRALGGAVEETEDGMVIHGGRRLSGGVVDSCNDHRIAMAAAVASAICENPVTVLDAQAVEKSYPRFWADLARMTLVPPHQGAVSPKD